MLNHIVLIAFMVNRYYILTIKLIDNGGFVTLLLHRNILTKKSNLRSILFQIGKKTQLSRHLNQ